VEKTGAKGSRILRLSESACGGKGSSEKETNVAAGFSLRCFDIHQREIAKEVLQRMDSPLP